MYENRLNEKKSSPYVVALDLGTSKILAIAGEKIAQKISILAMEQIPSGACIRRGCIYKIEDTINAVQTVINQLNRKLSSDIQKVYVGIGGQSLKMEYFSIKKEINGLVTEETLQHIEKELQTFLLSESAEILEVNLSEYYLDGKKEENPSNVYCKEIEAIYQLLLGRPSLKNLIKKSIEGIGIEVADFIISPLATAEAILSPAEKENGCALVELGAGVTYLSIYKNGKLKHLITIPLGGDVITKDISSGLHIVESEAEALKMNDGNALIDFDKKKEEQMLDMIVEARINEIIMNIVEQIKKSGYLSSINEGIVLTGGGSLLRNTDKLLAQQVNQKVYLSAIKNPAEACAWGILMLGKDDCAKIVPKSAEIPLLQEELPKNLSKQTHKREGLFGKLTRSFFDYEEER